MQACFILIVVFTFVEVLGQHGNIGHDTEYEGYRLIRAEPFSPAQLLALRNLRTAYSTSGNGTSIGTSNGTDNGTAATASTEMPQLVPRKLGVSATNITNTDAGAKNPQLLDFWSEPIKVNKPVDLMVPPDIVPMVESALRQQHIKFEILMKNVQDDIEAVQDIKAQLPRAAEEISFKTYNRVDRINEFLEAISENHPDIAETFSVGHSYEGRNMLAIKIGKDTGRRKPAVWIDAGIHAREWIAPATATYIIDQLVNNYAANRDLVDTVDWYILPVVNPDGYEYTFTNSRLWRKTRSRNPNSRCLGTDANRNFGFQWNKGGVSHDPCDETYRGSKAFSEIEAKNVADYLLSRKGQFQVYLSLHAYGQMWLTPWGYTSTVPSDYGDLIKLATQATRALATSRGTRYTVGSSTNVLYIASGGSDDWAKGLGGIKYAYTVELTDEGKHGFLLPASQILKTAKETFEAMKVVGEFAATLEPGKHIDDESPSLESPARQKMKRRRRRIIPLKY